MEGYPINTKLRSVSVSRVSVPFRGALVCL
nr:MAG TPA: hypothetical protein [Caudoviricetes sp.]